MKLKVACLNLWYTGPLLTAAIEFLKMQDADVVLLQEVLNGETTHNVVSQLREQLGYPFEDFAKTFVVEIEDLHIAQGNLILSKYPLAQQKVHFFIKGDREVYQDVADQWPLVPRILQHTTVDLPVGKTDLFNIQGVWDLDGDSASPQRKDMSEVIIRETAGKERVIFAGDTNAKQGNPIMVEIENHLKPVFNEPLKSTFNMRRKSNPGYATAAVDLMYVSENIGVVSKDIPDVDVSDHLPLVVTLDIN